MSCRKFLVLVVACLSVQALPVHAGEGDVFNINASVSSTRDNNLFRLAPSANPPGIDSRSDTINAVTLDFNFDKMFSRQRIVANAIVVDNRYQKNDYLSFTAFNYDAKWLWAAGSRWDGVLYIDRKEGLNSFADYRADRQRNIRTTENEGFTANYWFHSNWAAVAGVSRTSVTNEQPFLAENDYTSSGYNLGLRYRPISGNTLTLRMSNLDGSYAKRQFNVLNQFDNSFTDNAYGVDLDWLLTGKSQVRGRFGYTERQHANFSQRDYSGWVGNLDYIYAYTGKGKVTIGYKRDIAAYQQLTSSYYTLDEVNVSGQWAATSQITATARLGYGLRNYEGEIIPLPAGTSQREDAVSRLAFDLAYQPARWLQLKAGVGVENRNVNYDIYDYKDRTGFVSATAQY